MFFRSFFLYASLGKVTQRMKRPGEAALPFVGTLFRRHSDQVSWTSRTTRRPFLFLFSRIFQILQQKTEHRVAVTVFWVVSAFTITQVCLSRCPHSQSLGPLGGSPLHQHSLSQHHNQFLEDAVVTGILPRAILLFQVHLDGGYLLFGHLREEHQLRGLLSELVQLPPAAPLLHQEQIRDKGREVGRAEVHRIEVSDEATLFTHSIPDVTATAKTVGCSRPRSPSRASEP